jgi:AhpC/TSA antioxidant enzyme
MTTSFNNSETNEVIEHCIGTTCRPKKASRAWWRTHSQTSSTLETVAEMETMTTFSSKSSLPSHEGANEEMVSTIKLTPIECSFGIVTEKQNKVSLPHMIKKERRRLTSISSSGIMLVFAIRRPGCASCRLNGKIVAEVAKQEGVGCVGIIKEVGVADSSLTEMHDTYFRQPIYKDEKWQIYEAMGNRKVSFWKLVSKLPKLNPVYKKNKVVNVPFGGDLFTQGGILVFDKKGLLRYTYYERYGEFFDPVLLTHIIEQAKKPLCDASMSGSDASTSTVEIKSTNPIKT